MSKKRNLINTIELPKNIVAVKVLSEDRYSTFNQEFQKMVEWCQKNCDGVYGATRSKSTIDFFHPIRTEKEKAPNGESFPPSKVEMSGHYFLFFEDDGDKTKFILTWAGEDK